MQYGLALPNGGVCGDPHTLAEFAVLAEASGWDGVFLEDYIFYQGHFDIPSCDPWIAMAAMAVRTKHIRLGALVTPLARRRPWKLAREAVTLDHLTNGRLIVGIGLGNGNDPDFAQLGEETDARRRAGILDEALDVLIGLWSGEPFSYQGQHFQVQNVTCLPKPVQQPRIPIWVGGGWPLKGPTERALRWDGSCLYKHTYGGPWEDWTPDDIRSLKTLVEQQRGTGACFDIAPGGRERQDPDEDRALIRSLAEVGATWWVEGVALADPQVMREKIERGPLRID